MLIHSLKPGAYTPEERAEIARLSALGRSYRQIAEEIGRNSVAIGAYVRANGLPRRAYHRRRYQPTRGKCGDCGNATNFGRPYCWRCAARRRPPPPVPPELAEARAYVEKDLEHFREVRDGVETEQTVRIVAVFYIDVLLNVRKRLGVS